jgi:tetratricopeptide (TPR) repeat protein
VLVLLGELRRLRERLREAEAIAEGLDDDRRRARLSAVLVNTHSHLDKLEEALETGTRALEIAGRLGDLKLRIQTTAYLEQAHCYRGDYERVVELATENLAALPADWVSESYGNAPMSFFDRNWLVLSLTHLGRFAEAEQHEAEALRLTRMAQHAYPVGEVHVVGGWLHVCKGDWATARSRFERAIAEFRIGNTAILLPNAVASSAWVLAQVGETGEALDRLREGEQLLDSQATVGAVGFQGEVYYYLGRADLLLGQLDEARVFGNRALKQSSSRRGRAAYSLHLLGDVATHPDAFDAEEGQAYYRQALVLAEPRGMRPLVARCHLGLGKLFRHIGQPERARQHLTTATAMFLEMDMPFSSSRRRQ